MRVIRFTTTPIRTVSVYVCLPLILTCCASQVRMESGFHLACTGFMTRQICLLSQIRNILVFLSLCRSNTVLNFKITVVPISPSALISINCVLYAKNAFRMIPIINSDFVPSSFTILLLSQQCISTVGQ
jgi:hypothetical protein